MVVGPLNNPDSPMGIGAMCGEDYFTGLIDEVRINNPIYSLGKHCTQKINHKNISRTEINCSFERRDKFGDFGIP